MLLGHRQAFTWIDEWYDMSIDDVREYEKKMHAETNEKVQIKSDNESIPSSPKSVTPSGSIPSSPKSPNESANRSWFSWS